MKILFDKKDPLIAYDMHSYEYLSVKRIKKIIKPIFDNKKPFSVQYLVDKKIPFQIIERVKEVDNNTAVYIRIYNCMGLLLKNIYIPKDKTEPILKQI